MTEKDMALAEAGVGVDGGYGEGGGGGGCCDLVKTGLTYNHIDIGAGNGIIKDIQNHHHTQSNKNIIDEEDFLSTSPDSANGDIQNSIITKTTGTGTGARPTSSNKSKNIKKTKTKNSNNNNNNNNNHNNNNINHKINDKENSLKMSMTIFQCSCPTECVTLKNILDSFKSPLSEEQAWAVIYQFLALYRKIIGARTRARLLLTNSEIPDTIQNLNLHRDGSVHLSWSKEECQENAKPIVEHNKDDDVDVDDDADDAYDDDNEAQDKENSSKTVIGRAFDNHHTPLAVSHRKIIRKLAIIVYTALDYNLQADEQCQMSQELEELFTYMTADETDDDCIDEGIDEGDKRWDDENDDEKSNETKELDHILEACRNHVKPTVPEDHYKAVCRALVTETIELRVFLQHVLMTNGTERLKLQTDSQTSHKELAKLGFNDWARFWVQVIDELRRGVRLKKSNYERAPTEYELTPYEILMEDIRSKKYQLRKVMVNGDIPPRVKKDAHAVILEFIRSRPPLKKASERKLPPPVACTPTPREQLMDSIRKGRTLKPITPPPLPRLKDRLLPSTQMTSSTSAAQPSSSSSIAGGVSEVPRTKQRLIKVDFSLLQDDENFFEGSRRSHAHNNATNIGNFSQPKMPPYPIGGYIVKENTTQATAATNATNATNARNTRRTTYDLATQSESRRASVRRHTIVGCQSNVDETQSMPPSRPESRQSQTSEVVSSTVKEHHNNFNQEQQQRLKRTKSPSGSSAHNVVVVPSGSGLVDGVESNNSSRSASSLGPWNKSFLDKKTWMERGDDRLSLTLEEIVHIRSVMTKAELEGLPVGVRVKEDVEKRKVCFLCLRTRFSIFGPWGIQCKLCQRTVCSKCYTKMRIPSENDRNVPLVLISPSLLSSPASSSTPSPSHHAQYAHSSSTGNIDDTFPKTLIERLLRSESERKTRNSVGSAPSSPKHQRSNMSTPGTQAMNLRHATTNAAAAGQAVEAIHAASNAIGDNTMTSSYTAGAAVKPSPQLAAAKNNYNLMSRSMEGPRSLPVHSPARPLSSSSTLDRKSRFSRGFTLSASGSQLAQDQKENVRGEQVPVCNDCQGLVNEITSSAKQKRSSARNRTLQTLTLDLSPVWK